MTRKDFRVLAGIIATIEDPTLRETAVVNACRTCRAKNRRFDSDLFRAAVDCARAGVVASRIVARKAA